MAGAVVVGAAIRVAYIASFPTQSKLGYAQDLAGDGFLYHLQSLAWADGKHYAGWTGVPDAQHPPGWATVLGTFASFGGESIRSQQLFNAGIGLLLVVAIALLTRKIFGRRAGVIAAFIAATYPGFWVLEANLLAEPLALLMLTVILAAVYRLAAHVSLRNAVIVGLAVGVGALVRSELLAMLVLVVPVALWRAHDVDLRRRAALGGLVTVIVVACLVPWAAYNQSRFEEPVYLSTNLGGTLQAGNCETFDGARLGFYRLKCAIITARQHPGADPSELDKLSRADAVDSIGENLDRLPATMAARVGRTIGVYRTGQTVDFVAAWHGTREWPVWLWVASFWPLMILATLGALAARRQRVWLWPLVAPVVLALFVVLIFYGEPRYHTPADVSLVIFAAVAGASLTRRWSARRSPPVATSSAG